MIQKYKNMTTRQKIMVNLKIILTIVIVGIGMALIVKMLMGDSMSIKAEAFDAKIEIDMGQVKR